MTRASTARSTQESAAHAGAQDGQRGAFALKRPKRIKARLKALAAHLAPDEKVRVDKKEEVPTTLLQRPSSGRTTKLGRKVEKPGTGRQSGPSGQTDSVQHDRRHTNK
jgi:hypothetical protein